jgi:sugar lactone lactonase YvrE
MTTKILRNILLSLGVSFALSITTHAQNLYVSVNDDDSISEYTQAGVRATFTSGISQPRGLAFDSMGNLYAAITDSPDKHAVGKVVEFNPRTKPTAIGAATFYSVFEGVAIDAAGNVYVLSGGGKNPSTIFKFVPGVSRSIFATGFGQGFGLAFDSAGNLYAADAANQTISKFTPNGTGTVFAGPSAFTSSQAPIGLAFDSAGNLFVSTEDISAPPGSDTILEFTPSGMESTFATGLTKPRGLAFDGSGNLFVAETRPSPDGDILEFTTGGARIVFASGIARPEFLAFGPPR